MQNKDSLTPSGYHGTDLIGIPPSLYAPTLRPGAGLARIVWFFLVLAAALGGTHWAITAGLRRVQTSSFGVMNRLVSGQINADIVVTGSSRAVSHYDVRIIQAKTGRRAYNIGRTGSQTDMQLAVLKTYLAHNRKPSLVIHNLDLFSFLTSHEIYGAAEYIPYLNQPVIYSEVRRVYPEVWKWRYLPVYGYVTADLRFSWLVGIKALLGKQPAEDHFDGFQPRYLEWTADFAKYKESHPDGVRFEIEPEGVKDMMELMQLCQENQIPLLLVYSPVYFEMQALERNRDEIFEKWRELSARFSAELWDYSGSPLCQNRALFYNSQHLNAAGAKLFSTALASRLTETRALLHREGKSD